MSERRSRPALEALLVFEDVLSTLPGGRDGKVWVLADGGRFVVEPSSVESERGLRARGGLCDADQLGSQRGVFWGAGAEWKAFSGQQPKSAVCDGAVNCLLSSLSVFLNKAWQMVQGRAECRSVLQCVAVASETRESRAMSFVYEVRTDLAVGGGSGGQEAHGRRGRRQKSGIPPLCSSGSGSGGARVMTRLFAVVKPVKPWSESVAVRFKQRQMLCVEAFAVRFPASAGDG
jgi:hypothetical protein